jgi:hypothetical protein
MSERIPFTALSTAKSETRNANITACVTLTRFPTVRGYHREYDITLATLNNIRHAENNLAFPEHPHTTHDVAGISSRRERASLYRSKLAGFVASPCFFKFIDALVCHATCICFFACAVHNLTSAISTRLFAHLPY